MLLLGAAVVGGIYVFNRAADTISETFPSGLPTALPEQTSRPACPPRAWAQPIGVTVGDGFDLPRATIQPGWTLEAQGGVRSSRSPG